MMLVVVLQPTVLKRHHFLSLYLVFLNLRLTQIEALPTGQLI